MTIKDTEIEYAPVASATPIVLDAGFAQAYPVPSTAYTVPVVTATPLPSKASPNITVTSGQWVDNSAAGGKNYGKTDTPGPKMSYSSDGKVQSGMFHCSKCQDVSRVWSAIFRCSRMRFSGRFSFLYPRSVKIWRYCRLFLIYFTSCEPQPYDLPKGTTSWRCSACHHFNSTVQNECVIS